MGPSKTSKTPTNNDEETTLLNYEHEYDTFTNDVIGTSENNERNTTTFKREKKKKPRKKGRRNFGEIEKEEEKTRENISFDFRFGKEDWPKYCFLIEPEKGLELMENASQNAVEAQNKAKKKNSGTNVVSISGGYYGGDGGDDYDGFIDFTTWDLDDDDNNTISNTNNNNSNLTNAGNDWDQKKKSIDKCLNLSEITATHGNENKSNENKNTTYRGCARCSGTSFRFCAGDLSKRCWLR